MQDFKLLPELDYWPPSGAEIETHQKQRIPTIAKPNWPKRMRAIQHSPFLLPKYRQLIYWITTDSVLDGRRLIRTSYRGICSRCGVIASTTHMFRDCPVIRKVWDYADQLGSQHWSDFDKYNYEMIPDLISEYV